MRVLGLQRSPRCWSQCRLFPFHSDRFSLGMRNDCVLASRRRSISYLFTRQNPSRLHRPKLLSTAPLRCQGREREAHITGHGSSLSLSDHPNPEISCFYQKGFSQITRHPTGRALHALYIVMGLTNTLGQIHNNTLIAMYARFGELDAARYVFDNMPWKNEASWNSIISCFVRAGLYGESFGFFKEMMCSGVRPSGFAVASLMAGCDRSGFMLDEAVGVHGVAVKSGLIDDVFASTSILHFYGSYGMAFQARKLFEEMPVKNVVSWTALMVAYMNHGDPREVISLYSRMRREGFCCNSNNMATVISSCGSLEDELLGHQVVLHAIKFGLDTNVSVANSLLAMFGSFGSIKEAVHIFNSMNERDTITWNSLISVYVQNGFSKKSLECFYWMRRDHNEVNSATISALLSGLGSVDYLKWGRGIHCLVVKFGFDSDVYVCNTLLGLYSSAGELNCSEMIFDRMINKDSISWNSIMACYAQNGRCFDALKFFAMMPRWGHARTFVTFTSALAACSKPEHTREGKILHALAIMEGLHENSIVGNALVTLYSKVGMMEEAKKVLEQMPKRDEVTWNAIIGGYADNGKPDEALGAFRMMRQEAVPASYITMTNMLGACAAPSDLLRRGMPLHAYVATTGLESYGHVQNSLITMYAKCGDLNSSNQIFNGLVCRDEVAWNAIISANAHNGLVEEALKLLVLMRRDGLGMDQFNFSECIAATAKLAILEEGQQLHGLAVKLGFDSDNFVINATMDMYGKCGELDDMLRMIPEPLQRSCLSWNVLISSFAKHGHFEKAIETFDEMVQVGVRPDHVTFVCLLSACNHGGLVQEGLTYYNSMTSRFGVPAAIEHCVCVIDLLGRAGRLAQAETFIKDMPVPLNDLVWRSLLAACKLHGNLELSRKAAENLLQLDPSDDSAYVLYSNVCATTGKWEDLEIVRGRMGSNKIVKQPACSWVKLKNKTSSFGMGDQSHPQASLIYSKLEELKKMIHEAGYIPDTSYALQDTDEEQKEQNLWNHSERLALAFCLINSSEGSAIKIFKNLRVCIDCHSFFKFVSGILSRRIILRDPYRFHHFSCGTCSCRDYW